MSPLTNIVPSFYLNLRLHRPGTIVQPCLRLSLHHCHLVRRQPVEAVDDQVDQPVGGGDAGLDLGQFLGQLDQWRQVCVGIEGGDAGDRGA